MLDSKKNKSIKNPNLAINIYTLVDPRNPTCVKYVGKTVMDPKERLRSHINKIKYRKCYSSNWISSLLKAGASPSIEVIDRATEDN